MALWPISFAPKQVINQVLTKIILLKAGYIIFFKSPPNIFVINMPTKCLITSEPDRIRFPNKIVHVVQGGVDISESQKYLKSDKKFDYEKKI